MKMIHHSRIMRRLRNILKAKMWYSSFFQVLFLSFFSCLCRFSQNPVCLLSESMFFTNATNETKVGTVNFFPCWLYVNMIKTSDYFKRDIGEVCGGCKKAHYSLIRTFIIPQSQQEKYFPAAITKIPFKLLSFFNERSSYREWNNGRHPSTPGTPRFHLVPPSTHDKESKLESAKPDLCFPAKCVSEVSFVHIKREKTLTHSTGSHIVIVEREEGWNSRCS